MCGILFTNNPKIGDNEFNNALLLQAHRGPDVPSNLFLKNNIKLGHNRLSILDLGERSNQPFFTDDMRFGIVYNGEIYNYRELTKQYHIELKTTSDTELLLKLYVQYGEKMLSWLNGIWAFVIYDFEQNSFFASRDRLGVKPLYFTDYGGYVSFSSEIAALLQINSNHEIDETGLRQYKKLRTFFRGHTLYKNISMFPAGSFSKNGKISKFWDLPIGEKPAPSDEELLSLIQTSIDYRMIADVPVGSYLSGGLDSTIVAGLAKQPHTWTVGSHENNEFEWARIAADKFKSVHHEVIVQNNDYAQTAEWMIKKRKEPLSVPNEILLYLMTLEVKKFNTVVLSGEGADELFFGYDRIFRWANSAAEWNLKEFADLYCYGSEDDFDIVDYVIEPFKKYGSSINITASFFQISHLHGLLRRLDNSTMLCGVEAREPFVDYRLIERMSGVPFDYRMKNGIVKEPLKRLYSNLVPKEIIERKKVGFPVLLESVIPSTISGKTPMDKWLNFNLNVLGIK